MNRTDIENLVNISFRKAKELMAITLKLNYVPAHGMHPFDAPLPKRTVETCVLGCCKHANHDKLPKHDEHTFCVADTTCFANNDTLK